MARQKPRIVFLCALVFIALLAPSAGKTLVQTTPMRLIVAAIPLGAVPLIAMLERRSRAVLTAFWLFTIVSLDTALSYNLHHLRSGGDTLVDWSFSGWKFNLLFPYDSRQPWHVSTGNGLLLVFWLAVVVALLAAPALIEWQRAGGSPPRQDIRWIRRPIAQAFAAVVVFVLLGTAGSAMTREWTLPKYLPPVPEAAQRAAWKLDDIGTCTFCIWSPIGWISTRRMSTALTTIHPLLATRRPGERPEYAEWIAMPGEIRAWYLEATGHEPSPGDIGHHLYQWREEGIAPAEIRRRIFAAAGKPQ
jgi:FtsH-binding integral membrane protein